MVVDWAAPWAVHLVDVKADRLVVLKAVALAVHWAVVKAGLLVVLKAGPKVVWSVGQWAVLLDRVH